ncbi:MAG: NDP-sugar synthase [Chloroherpetonaceae bacterium]|nr:NDP-sugar synthase [Chthonomonadaceae bacterium]MDW8207902.1 NDP-sugar synthase [Chloroherpetonaceae bacterium]
MKGIIIAGGLGTRLRPLTYHRPKPLVPVANRPFLEYQVAHLRKYGIDDIVFATNYMAEQIEAHFGDGSRFGVRMRYAIEEEPLGTGGAIRNAAELFPGETVVVFNGDVLTDFDIEAVLTFHMQKQASATIFLSEVPSPHPFGVLILDDDGMVREWREPSEETKQTLALDQDIVPTGKDLINAGFYVLSPRCIERIPRGVRSSIERDIYPQLIAERAGVYGIAPGGFWMDVGRAEQLLLATQAVLMGQVRTAVPGLSVGEGTTIAPSTWINGLTAIGRHCRIGEDSRLENCIIMDNVLIGNRVRLTGVIVDSEAVIEDEVVVAGRGAGATPVIAGGSVLGRGTRLHL